MAHFLSGKFIVIDGGDGCGKSTQVKMLTEWIQSHQVNVVTARDPGGTVIGEKIRDILLNPDHEGMGDNVEVMLYMASRAQLWKEIIKPALENNHCVLLDRWLSSTCAYQGCAGRFGTEQILNIARDTLERLWPDKTIILDVDLDTAAQRMNRQLDRMEMKGKNYHQNVRKGFLKFAEIDTSVAVIDAGRSIEQVHQDVITAIETMQ